MKNAYTIQELKDIITTMEQIPTMVDSMQIELRPQETGGRIDKKTDGEVVFVPKHYEMPRGPYGRD